MIRSAALILLAACSTTDTRALVVDGPAQVRVDHLGPVEGPAVQLSDGTAAEGLTWTVSPETVAVRDGDGVRAVGPGEATIEATWNEQRVTWTLVVDPRVSLNLVHPPATLAVGDRRPLHVEARIGDTNTDPGALSWRSTAPEVATVSEAGEVVAVAPGTTYVVVTHGESEAMAEIQVVPSE